MKAEWWQIFYLLAVIIGLLIGYRFDPLAGLGFIWVLIIAAELIKP